MKKFLAYVLISVFLAFFGISRHAVGNWMVKWILIAGMVGLILLFGFAVLMGFYNRFIAPRVKTKQT